MAKSIQHFGLNNGAKIPSVGLGTWKAAAGVVGDAITAAIKVYIQSHCEVKLNFVLIWCSSGLIDCFSSINN